jgi:flagellar protein FliL
MTTFGRNILESRIPRRDSLATLIIVVSLEIVVSTLAASAGVYYYCLRQGRMHVMPSAPSPGGASVHESGHIINLDTFLVNLADSHKTAYLKVGIAVRVNEHEPSNVGDSKNIENNKIDGDIITSWRDITLETLGRQTSDNLLSPNGKEALKAEILKSVNAKSKAARITDVYFSEFLVQQQ